MQDNDYQTLEAVGAATVSRNFEFTVNFDALKAAGLSDPQAKMQTIMALQKPQAYIENRSVWPPA